jgi:hypothetical protein
LIGSKLALFRLPWKKNSLSSRDLLNQRGIVATGTPASPLLRARLRRILSGSLSGACWRLPGQEAADLPGAPGFAVKRRRKREAQENWGR